MPASFDDDGGPPTDEEVAQEAIEPLLEHWPAQFGERWAGAWIEWNPRSVYVSIVDPTLSDIESLSAASEDAGWHVAVVAARYSSDEIEAFCSRAAEGLVRSSSTISFGPDVRHNAVRVELDRVDDAVISQLSRTVPTDALVLAVTPRGRIIRL